MATTFFDKENRTWDLRISVSTIRRVRVACKVNLYDALEGELMIQLGQDPVLFADVLWAIVEPQAIAANVTDDQFGDALLGEAIDLASKAFIEGLTGFFGRPGQRALLKGMAEKTERAMAAAEQISHQRLSDLDVEKMVQEEVDRIELSRQSGSSTKPPASAGSTPTPSPSESSPPCTRPGNEPSGAEPVTSCS